MGSKSCNKVTDQVCPGFNIIEPVHIIELLKQVIDIIGHTYKIITTISGNYKILNLELYDLVFILNRVAIAVIFITHFKQFVY